MWNFYKEYFNSLPISYISINHPNALCITLLHAIFCILSLFSIYSHPDLLKLVSKSYGHTHYKVLGSIFL